MSTHKKHETESTLSIIAAIAIFAAHAQSDTDLYTLTPDYMQQVFTDIISTEYRVVHYSDGEGSYDGHSRNNKFFGWGSYQTENGAIDYGLWLGDDKQ